MFEIGWSELLVIGIVLIVVVGPKDLPKMLRTFGKVSGQMRRMAGDFRKQFDEALREAELGDVRDTVNEMRSLDPTKDIRNALNPIRAVGDEIRSSLTAATKAPEPKIASATAPAVAVTAADMTPLTATSDIGTGAGMSSPPAGAAVAPSAETHGGDFSPAVAPSALNGAHPAALQTKPDEKIASGEAL